MPARDGKSICKFKSCLISGVVWMSLLGSASAASSTVDFTFTQPTLTGGLIVNGIPVIGIGPADSPATKAAKIVAAVNAHLPGNLTCTGMPACTSGTVSTTKPGGITISGDLTGELKFDAVVHATGAIKSYIDILDYEGTLSGVDSSGAPSIFSASIGYDGLTDSATVTYSTGLTDAGLTSDMYAALLGGLPSALQPDLSLNGAEIDFALPAGQTNGFVDSSTTDTGVELSGGIEGTVPEPASLLLFGCGAAGLISRRYRLRSRSWNASRHQSQPSPTTW